MNEAYEDKDSKFHKMVSQTKMSRNRFIKLLMATGLTRNKAEELAKMVVESGYSYLDTFDHNVYDAVRRINNRWYSLHREEILKHPEQMLLSAIFDDRWPEGGPIDDITGKRKELWNDFIAWAAAHPEVKDRETLEAARTKYILDNMEPTGEMHEGCPVSRPKIDMKEFTKREIEFRKARQWLEFWESHHDQSM